MPNDRNFIEGREIHELRVQKRDGFFGVTLPVTVRLEGAVSALAANYTTPFFVAQRPYIVIEVSERHETAGGAPGDATVMLKKVPSGTAPGSGTSMLASAIALTTTANTIQYGTLHATLANRRLADGDSLALVSSGTITAVVGVTVSVLLQAI